MSIDENFDTIDPLLDIWREEIFITKLYAEIHIQAQIPLDNINTDIFKIISWSGKTLNEIGDCSDLFISMPEIWNSKIHYKKNFDLMSPYDEHLFSKDYLNTWVDKFGFIDTNTSMMINHNCKKIKKDIY